MSYTTNRKLFFFQGSKIVSVRQDETARTIFRTAELPLAELSGNKCELLATDQKNSVLTTSDKEKLEVLTYTAYGYSPALRDSSKMLGFNGEFLDQILEAYLLGNGYRVFGNTHFYSPDSLSPFGAGGLNGYGYCAGDPINKSDPSGHVGLYRKRNPVDPRTQSGGTPLGAFERLPIDDILPHIQQYLSPTDTVNLASTSTKMFDYVKATSDKFSKTRVNLDNILEQETWQRNGTLNTSFVERAGELTAPAINDLLELERQSERAGFPLDSPTSGRRRALIGRPVVRPNSIDRLDTLIQINSASKSNQEVRRQR